MPTAAYGPLSYYRPGATYPRTGLRVPYPEVGKERRKRQRAAGIPDPPFPTVPPTPGPGWAADDQGLVPELPGVRVVYPGEVRRYVMDFGPMGELVGGDTLTGPTAQAFPFGLLAGDAAVLDGGRVGVTVQRATVPGWYRVRVTAPTAAGLVLVRSGPVYVPPVRVNVAPATIGAPGMPLIAAVGWYATDDGLAADWAFPHRKGPGERRRFFLDFSGLTEVSAGDTITGTPVLASDPPGLTLSDLAVTAGAFGPAVRVEVTVEGGVVDTDYDLVVTPTFTGGETVSRRGQISVVDL